MSEKLHTYKGKDIVVEYSVKRCIHAAECVHGLSGVFDPKRKPWIEPDAATADELAAVIERCPTGALHYKRLDGGSTEKTPDKNLIRIGEDDCLYLHGDFEIIAKDGSTTDTRIALCRCGLSKNKPYCDNSHREGGFKDVGSLGTTGAAIEPTNSSSRVVLTLAENGPVLIQGEVEIQNAGGGESICVSKGALCRCGASQNKPFCDGSHKGIDFQAEG
ncbi:MAG: CDGSH iron-sulfur domain-containing protein [Calditrichia bacterium]